MTNTTRDKELPTMSRAQFINKMMEHQEFKERPILFSPPMVRAILDGRKTMTRRVVKPQPEYVYGLTVSKWSVGAIISNAPAINNNLPTTKCPYGVHFNQLWVRETFRIENVSSDRKAVQVKYRAGGLSNWIEWPGKSQSFKWTPSIYMPRAFSRIDLKITDIRVERLQDISEEDAEMEGVFCDNVIVDVKCYSGDPVEINEDRYFYDGCGDEVFETADDAFQHLWDSINGKSDYSWDANPYVWIIEFERVTI